MKNSVINKICPSHWQEIWEWEQYRKCEEWNSFCCLYTQFIYWICIHFHVCFKCLLPNCLGRCLLWPCPQTETWASTWRIPAGLANLSIATRSFFCNGRRSRAAGTTDTSSRSLPHKRCFLEERINKGLINNRRNMVILPT